MNKKKNHQIVLLELEKNTKAKVTVKIVDFKGTPEKTDTWIWEDAYMAKGSLFF